MVKSIFLPTAYTNTRKLIRVHSSVLRFPIAKCHTRILIIINHNRLEQPIEPPQNIPISKTNRSNSIINVLNSNEFDSNVTDPRRDVRERSNPFDFQTFGANVVSRWPPAEDIDIAPILLCQCLFCQPDEYISRICI